MLLVAWVFAVFLSNTARAQAIDFDGACAAPPCAVGSLFAPLGVTFAPADAQIVDAGTTGLTGPVGGRYLLLSTPPYQATIALSRPATSFMVRVARSDIASSDMTVTVTWRKGGTGVGSQIIHLGSVDRWSLAEITVPGGFDSLSFTANGMGPDLSFGIDGLQFGGRCAGFADVNADDIFCNATEWLANRGVTLGCAAGQYCPTQAVTRAQMALFMQRMADAQAPATLRYSGTDPGISTGIVTFRLDVCMTPPLPAASWPRQASISVALVMQPPAASTWRVAPSLTSNEGASFELALAEPNYFSFAANELGTVHHHVDGIRIAPNRSYRFAALLDRWQGTVASGTVGCRISVKIDNARAMSAPFDARPSDGDAMFNVQ